MARRCEICKLDLQDESSYQGHIQGKRHLKNAEQVEYVNSIVQRSIFVSRIPADIPSNGLLKFFSQFGEIAKFRFGPNHLIVEFRKKDPVKVLLTKPIYFSGTRLNIHRRIMHDNKPSPRKGNKNVEEAINDTVDLNYENIKSIFEVELTFDEQLAAFLDRVAISESEIEERYEPTCSRLDELFRNVFPKCKAYRFGSTVSGLGFKNCDLDLYMDIGVPVSQEKNGNLGPNVVTTAVVFSEVKRILYARSAIFSKVVPIPKAKTPIIKFFYVPTEIACDISFKNSLAVHNSRLVKFCLSLDPRLRPAMMVIKYWVCNYELRGGDKMSKYALTTLFIFYLQQPSVKLVPPIIELKRRCVPEIIEGWQVNFDTKTPTNYEQNEIVSSNKSIPELLHGFFEFYANFDFKSYVLSTIDGLPHKRIIFQDTENLPESMDRYKEYLMTKENPVPFPITKPMCVQDPNELNHNVTGNVCAKYLENFQSYCAGASEICAAQVEKNYRELLPSIFSLTIKSHNKESDVCFLYYANNFLKVGLSEDVESRTDIADKALFIREHWYDLVFTIIKKYFENVLKLQIQMTNTERELKQQKIEEQSDVHSNDQDKIVMRCTGDYCLWRDRKVKLNMLDPSISLLDKETEITDSVFEELSAKNKLVKLKIDFDCQIYKKGGQPVHLIFKLSNNYCTKKIFPELANHIKKNLPFLLNKTLTHMQQFKKELSTET